MSAKMESRQCTPSVIAKLMDLDEMLPHQPVHKKQRVLSEDYLRRVASVGVRGKRSTHEQHGENKEFKDIFEVHEKLKRECCNLPVERGKFNLNSSAAKEVCNAWVVVDSKIDLFMKYLQEPDFLITDPLCNLQGIPYHLQSSCLKVLKTSNASDTGMTDICSICGRETDQESAKLLQKLETGFVTDTRGEPVPGNGYKLLESQKESDNLPTKIVVLKPKLGKKENAGRCFPPCSSCRDSHSIDMKHNSHEKGNLYTEEKEKTNVNKDVEPVSSRFRISGKLSGQTGQAKSNLFMKVSKPDSRDNDTFGKETELKTFISPNSCEWENHQKPSFYHSDGSYVGRKGRKKILERLETSKKFQEVEAASGSCTLGVMLAVPDQESSSGNLDCRLSQCFRSCQNGLLGNLFTRPLESANKLQHRFRKQSHNQKKGSEYRNSGSSCMKSQSFPWMESVNSYLVQDDHVLQGELNRKLAEKDTCERTNLVIKSSVDTFASASMIADMVSDAKSGVEGQSSENYKEKHSEKTDFKLLVEDGYFSSQFPYASNQQDMSVGIFKEDSGIDPKSLVNSEEAYQSSPNSVLKPFEKEILSSSACFQGVDVNLRDLQFQLELLKSDSSETYSEGDGMIVSSDDDFELGSVSNGGKSEQFMRTTRIEEGRDFSYLVDIFTEAGFHGRNSVTNYETWHSPDCPISPAVFEMLEKKYGEQISWKRSERRLLFDHINSELMEILQPSMWTHWTKPLSTRLYVGKSFEMIEEELWRLLDHQKKQTNKDSSVKMMGKDDRWLELGGDIEVIVREVEDSLIGQLATEVISMESF